MDRSPAEHLKFGPFELDTRSLELSREGRPVALAPQPGKVLALLASRSGQLVTREELREHVWGDLAVEFETGLHTCIRQIRRALDDDSSSPDFIQTVPRRGYRFVAPVVAANGAPGVAGGPATRHRSLIMGMALGLALLLVLLLGGRLVPDSVSEPAERIVMVVLPFDNLTTDDGLDVLAYGLGEELRTELGRLDPERLGVIARTSSMRYRDRETTIAEIGRELGVTHVLEGSVRRTPGGLSVGAHLARVEDQEQVWAERFPWRSEEEGDPVVAVARRVTGALLPELALGVIAPGGGDQRTIEVDPRALRPFREARALLSTASAGEAIRALALFEDAVATDPSFAAAQASLAQTYRRLGRFDDAEQAALRALELDETLASAYRVLGEVHLFGRLSPASAEPWYRRALSLAPDDPEALQGYASWLLAEGRPEEAIGPLRKALERDPVSPLIHNHLTWNLFYARLYDETLEQSERSLDLLPDLLPVLRCRFFVALVRDEVELAKRLALELLELERNEGSDDAGEIRGLSAEEATQWYLRREIEKVPARGGTNPNSYLARLYALTGQPDQAFEALERSIDNREPRSLFIRVDPRLDGLREDPHFEAIL